MRVNLSPRYARRAAAMLVGMLVIACTRDSSRNDTAAASHRGTVADSMGAAPTMVSRIPMHIRHELRENSAAAMSRTQPGVIFTINDSHNPPTLFAFDTTGADRGAWHVLDATNIDWEAIAVGPCQPAGHDTSCLYIGDVGDNSSAYGSRVIYRVAEPTAQAGGYTGTVTPERLEFRYPDGPLDVEAMVVARNGDVLLVSKRPRRSANGTLRPASVFRIPRSAWTAKASVVAELVDSIPIIPGSAPLRLITDAALSPDARFLAVRTYSQTFIFAVDSLTGTVDHGIAPAICDIVSLGEDQGEGVTWLDSSGRLAFTSEGVHAPLFLADCPLPGASPSTTSKP